MAMTKDGSKGSYYSDEGPEIPSAGGDYGHPTPHSAKVDQRPFQAPSGDDGTGTGPQSNGYAATDNPQLTRLGGIDTTGQDAANAAFSAAASQPQPREADLRA